MYILQIDASYTKLYIFVDILSGNIHVTYANQNLFDTIANLSNS